MIPVAGMSIKVYISPCITCNNCHMGIVSIRGYIACRGICRVCDVSCFRKILKNTVDVYPCICVGMPCAVCSQPPCMYSLRYKVGTVISIIISICVVVVRRIHICLAVAFAVCISRIPVSIGYNGVFRYIFIAYLSCLVILTISCSL